MKKRKDGRYAAQIVVGHQPVLGADGLPRFDKNGQPLKRKILHTVYGATQKEVNEAVAQAKVDYGKGVDIKAANDNFSLWAERFLANKEAQGLSPGHIVSLRGSQKYLAPLSALPLSKITIGDIQAIIDNLAQWHPKTRTGWMPAARRLWRREPCSASSRRPVKSSSWPSRPVWSHTTPPTMSPFPKTPPR